ncbi:hypothetical protein PoB_005135400 [Plakobranchus ocellatus]|uniref:Uncharacterized protein n=1 Tax=Plakobranchus ocellatus TaxID=259542 RepID=A0AAV4C144_9GAST|nr:hypothetical protein PoB_005135400 [Plakobranchus ocellatus]
MRSINRTDIPYPRSGLGITTCFTSTLHPRSSYRWYTMPLAFSKETTFPPLRQVLPASTSASILGSSFWSLINCSRSTPTCLRFALRCRPGHRRTHHQRHVGVLQAPSSFHILNDDITDGVRDSQHLHFSTNERRPQADDCRLYQQRSVVYPQQ